MDELIMCEVCGRVGIEGKEIIEAEYYDNFFKRDNTRYECRAIWDCLDRAQARNRNTLAGRLV